MNPRIAKEIRVLLPAFGLILAAAAMPMVIGPNRHEIAETWMGVLFGLGCLIMGAEVFGNEFHQKTLPLLLTQPVPRTSIWREKMLVLGLALTLGAGAFRVGIRLFHEQIFRDAEIPWVAFAMIPIGIFCTVPYWTLLLRTTLAGGLVAVVMPGLLLGVNSYLHERGIEHGNSILNNWFRVNSYLHQSWVKNPASEEGSVITLLILYSAVCCWLGFRKFKHMQVVDAYSLTASRELGLPPRFEAFLLRPFRALSAPFTGHVATLVKKELRLQQAAFLAAAVFCLMVSLETVLHHRQFEAHQGQDWASLLLVCTVWFYLLVLPLIAGAVAVAEEKAWGVADWHLTLPPSALKQWTVKIIVALGTSVVLGLLLPAVLALIGAALFGTDEPGSLPRLHSLRSALSASGGSLAPLSLVAALFCCILLGQALLTSVAIHAGSIASNTARALILALGMLIATGFVIHFVGRNAYEHWNIENRIRDAAQSGVTLEDIQTCFFALLAMELFLLVGVIQYFAYRCFRARGMSRGMLRIQAPVLLLVVCLLTIAFVFGTFSGILWR